LIGGDPVRRKMLRVAGKNGDRRVRGYNKKVGVRGRVGGISVFKVYCN